MSVKKPRVSIVIPVYNGSNFLTDAINSALKQTYSNIEVLVVNDGSDDDGKTERIALSYGKKIKYLNKPNGGVASALNYGIGAMTGDFFSWLSHDDIYTSHKVEKQIEFFLSQEDKKTVIASNTYALFDNGIRKKETINKEIFDSFTMMFLATSVRTGLNGCSLLIPRDVLLESGGFRENLPVTQDYDLWSRMAKSVKFKLLDEYLVMYRHHGAQDSVKKSADIARDGDKLRARLLEEMSEDYLLRFIRYRKSNVKWLESSCRQFRVKGYLLTALSIIKNIEKLETNIISDKFYSKELALVATDLKNKGLSILKPDSTKKEMIDYLEILISDHKDKIYNQPSVDRHGIISYIDSIKNDGLVFFMRKAFRKLCNLLLKRS